MRTDRERRGAHQGSEIGKVEGLRSHLKLVARDLDTGRSIWVVLQRLLPDPALQELHSRCVSPLLALVDSNQLVDSVRLSGHHEGVEWAKRFWPKEEP